MLLIEVGCSSNHIGFTCVPDLIGDTLVPVIQLAAHYVIGTQGLLTQFPVLIVLVLLNLLSLPVYA